MKYIPYKSPTREDLYGKFMRNLIRNVIDILVVSKEYLYRCDLLHGCLIIPPHEWFDCEVLQYLIRWYVDN